VDGLVCTLNLCLLWTSLLRIRLCGKHVGFQRFLVDLFQTQSVALLLSRMSLPCLTLLGGIIRLLHVFVFIMTQWVFATVSLAIIE